jgi:single-strand DNA-binding protein
MINRVILVGRLTKDPVLRKTGAGKSVVSFTTACDRKVKVDGQPTADFINCIAWNKVADLMAQYLHKGSLVGVEGRIQTRSYDDQTGKRIYITEVVADSVQFLESKSASTNNAQGGYTPDYNANNQDYEPDTSRASYPNDNDTLKIAEEDLPF